MAAVISGSGLGVFNGSLSQLGMGLGGGARLGRGQDSQYVNVANGNLVLHSRDEQLLFRGMSLGQARTYNSLGMSAQMGSDGWLTGFERRVQLLSGVLNQSGSSMRLHTGDGSYQDFGYFPNGVGYQSIVGDGAHDTLAWDASSSTWTYVEGSTRRQETYADHANATLAGRLIRLRDLSSDGTTPVTWDVLYDGSGRISEVRSQDAAAGAAADGFVFGYDAGGRLSTVSTRENGVVRGQVTYGYDSVGRLSGVLVDLTPLDGSGDRESWDAGTAGNNDGYLFRTSYTYVDASSLRIGQVRQSDGTLASYTYDANGRIKTLTQGDTNADDADGFGQTVTFTYDTANRSTDVSDSTGRTWSYVHDAAGQLVQVKAPALAGQRDVTSYTYSSDKLIQSKTERGGLTLSQSDYRYDARGNRVGQWERVASGTGTAATVVRRTYTATNQLETVATYTGLDADGVGSQAATGELVVRYVYDAQDRLRFTVDATGGVHETEYATAGNGIGQVLRERQYLGGYSGAFTLAALTTWATPAQKANSTLTDYAYDAKGRSSQVRAFAAVDASGNGISDDTTRIVDVVYDAQGLLRQQISRRSATDQVNDGRDTAQTITYVYDGMGRLLSEVLTEQIGTGPVRTLSTAAWTYQDAAMTLRTVIEGGLAGDGNIDNDLLRIEVRNAAGQVVVVNELALSLINPVRNTQHGYDGAGRLRWTQDGDGARTYFFYDAEGALQGRVDETGAVVEYVRDDLGRVVNTIAYATRVSTASWLTAQPASLARPAADAANDRRTTATYDALGRLTTQTDAEGAITTYTYDGAGRLLQARTTDALQTAATARTIRNFYDAAGRQTGMLDAEGYLVEYGYDRGGRRILTTRYAVATAVAQRAAGSLDQLRPATSPADQRTRHFYDGQDHRVGELDAEGYLTEYVVDEARNQRAVRGYASRLTGLAGSETLATLRSRAGAARETRRSFDARGLVQVEVDPEGSVTRYTYDARGLLLKTESAIGTTELREGHRRYDAFGSLIGELGGEGAARITAGMTQAQLDAVYAQYGVRHEYHATGTRISSVDAEGNRTWYFYDTARRPIYSVRGVRDASGVLNAQAEVTETVYNAFGDVSRTTAFTARLTIAPPYGRGQASDALRALVYTAASQQTYGYNRRGQLTETRDAENVSTTQTYSAFGEVATTGVQIDATRTLVTGMAYDRRGLRIGQTDDVGGLAHAQTWVRDAFGRALSSTDARGQVTTFDYDRRGRQVSQSQTFTAHSDAAEHTERTQTAYDAYGRVLTQTDALNNVTRYAYNDASRSVVVTMPEGVSMTTVRTRHGQVQTIRDGRGNETRYTYDRDGHLRTTSTPTAAAGVSATTENTYNARGLLIQITDPTGRKVDLAYDAAGRVLSRIEDPAGLKLTTRYSYDGQGRQITVVDPAGSTTSMAYDRKGQLRETVRDVGGLALKTTYTWDGRGKQLSVTEAAGSAAAQHTVYSYDALGRRTAQTQDPAGLNLTTTYAYDGNGNLVNRTDASGAITRYTYDAANRLIHTVDGLGGVTENRYDAAGRVVETRQYVGFISLATFGAAVTAAQVEAQLSAIKPSNAFNPPTYDPNDPFATRVLLQAEIFYHQVSYGYDGLGRRISETIAVIGGQAGESLQILNLVSTFAYDGNGNLTVRTDGSGVVTRYTYDAVNRLVHTVDGSGGVTVNRYDLAGRLQETRAYVTRISVPAGQALSTASVDALLTAAASDQRVTYEYDGVGRRSKQTLDPGGLNLVTTFAYDGSGNLASRTDPELRVTRYTYDAANRLIFTVDGAGGVTRTWYDAAGRVVASRRYAEVIALSGFGARITSAEVLARVVELPERDVQEYRVYDAAGRLRFTVDGVGATVGYRYDATGRLTQTRRYATAVSLTAALRAQLQAGTAGAAFAGQLTADGARDQLSSQVLDAAGRVHFIVDASGNVTENRYDAAGRVLETIGYEPRLGTTPPYAYVGLTAAQLEQVRSGAIGVAGLGALVSSQLTAGRAQASLYDAAGRLVYTITRAASSVGSDAGVLRAFEYDGAGRLVKDATFENHTSRYFFPQSLYDIAISMPPGGSRQTTYQYDAAGRLHATIDPASGRTEQIYNGAGDVVESRRYESATVFRSTVSSYDAAGRLRSVTDALNKTESYGYDGAGLRTAYTNRDGHTWNYSHDAAGRVLTETSPTVTVTSLDAGGNPIVESRRILARNRYDALGNVIARTQDDGSAGARRTDYVYDNRGHQVQTIFPDPHVWNASTGQFVASNVRPSTQVTYDTLGRAVVMRDVLGNHSYRVYGVDGTLSHEIDPAGYLTGYEYNAHGEQTLLRRYANPVAVTAGQPVSAAAARQLASTATDVRNDRVLLTHYDPAGRKHEVIQLVAVQRADGSWALDRFEYDAAKSPVTRLTYNGYGLVSRSSVKIAAASGPLGEQWAVTATWYDDGGREIARLDPQGYLTRWQYDARGQVLEQIEHARSLGDAHNVSPDGEPYYAGAGDLSIPAPGDAATGDDRRIVYTYDALGRKTSETVQRRYQDVHGTEGVRDVLTAIGYDNEGHATTVAVDGVATATRYDGLGRVVSVREAEREVVRDNAVDLLQGGMGLGSAGLYARSSPYSTLQYDAFGNVVQLRRYARGWIAGEGSPNTSAGDSVHTTRYDRQGRAVWERDAAGTDYVKQYDAADRLLSIRHRLDGFDSGAETPGWSTVVTVATYDALGRQLSTRVSRELPNGSVQADAQSQVRYNAFGEIIAKDAALDPQRATGAFAAQYAYDQAGNLSRSNADGGIVRHYGYDLAGRQVSARHDTLVESAPGVTAVQSVSTFNELDRLGRVTRQRIPDEVDGLLDIRRSYDRWGNVLSVTDPRGHSTTYQYNALDKVTVERGPPVQVVLPGGTTLASPEQRWFYDALGRQIAARDANGHTRTTQYDASGRVISVRDATDGATRSAYDALGQARLTQDALGYRSFRDVDAAGRVTAQGDYLAAAGGGFTRTFREQYRLNQNGDRIAVANGLGQTARYAYDSRGLVLRSQTAAGVVTTFGYDAQGQKIRQTNALSDASLIGGTAARVSKVDHEGETVYLHEQTWDYDVFGRLTDHNDLSGADYDYVYHAQTGQLIQQSTRWTAQGQVIETPGAGRTSGGTNPQMPETLNGPATPPPDPALPTVGTTTGVRSLSYDRNGQLKEIRDANASAGAENWTRYGYDDAGNRTLEETRTRDGNGQVVHLRTTSGYDGLNRLVQVSQEDVVASHTLVTVTYGYDAAGNRTRVLASNDYDGRADEPYELNNANFESGNTGWELGERWGVSSENPAFGVWSAQFSGRPDSDASEIINRQRVAVTAGESIHASAKVTVGEPAPDISPGDAWGAVVVVWYDELGQRIGHASGPQVRFDTRSDDVISQTHVSEGRFVVPPGAAFMSIGALAQVTNKKALSVDDFSLSLAGPATSSKDYWYAYDADHRVTVANGRVVNGEVVLGLTDISYALDYVNGQAVRRRSLQGGQLMAQSTAYDARGRRETVYQATAVGSASVQTLAERFEYDAADRQLAHLTYAGNGALKHMDSLAYDQDGRILRQTSRGHSADMTGNLWAERGLVLLSQVDYGYAGGYDAAGRLAGYSYYVARRETGVGAANAPIGYAHFYTYQYEAREGYLEKQVYGHSTEANFRASTSYSVYDAWGQRVAVRERTPLASNLGTLEDRVRYVAYDAQGNALQRRQGALVNGAFRQDAADVVQDQRYAYVSGQQVVSGKRTGEVDLVGRLTGYDSGDAGSVQVPVQAGDTLRSLAQRIYGNANLWYVLAEANALDGEPVEGTTLTVPALTMNRNDAATFKPFNPAEAIGDSTPTLPYIAPPPKESCNALATILMVVIAVVVTVYTAGLATAGVVSGGLGASATFSAGLATLAGAGGVGAAVTAGVVGGIAGSVASQAVGSALGESSFSWRSALATGAATGITAGLGSAGVVGRLAAGGSNFAYGAASAVTSALVNQATNRVFGVDTSFSWRAIAANAVAGGLTATTVPKLGNGLGIDPRTTAGQTRMDLLGGAVGGVVSYHTRRLFGEPGGNAAQIAADAFGNILGNRLAGKHAYEAGLLGESAALMVEGRGAGGGIGGGGTTESDMLPSDGGWGRSRIVTDDDAASPRAAAALTLPTVTVTATAEEQRAAWDAPLLLSPYLNTWVSNGALRQNTQTGRWALKLPAYAAHSDQITHLQRITANGTGQRPSVVIGDSAVGVEPMPGASTYDAAMGSRLLTQAQEDFGVASAKSTADRLGLRTPSAAELEYTMRTGRPMPGMHALTSADTAARAQQEIFAQGHAARLSNPFASISSLIAAGADSPGSVAQDRAALGTAAITQPLLDVAGALIVAPPAGRTSASTIGRNTFILDEALSVGKAVTKSASGLSFGELRALKTAGLSRAEIARHIELNGDIYLFRGTSEGWVGSSAAQATAVSASTDPYVATVFALEARTQAGQAVLQFGSRSEIGAFTKGNWFAAREREVGVLTNASGFAGRAPYSIPVDRARNILSEMGMPALPRSLPGEDRLKLLREVPRMTPEQTAEFLRRARNGE